MNRYMIRALMIAACAATLIPIGVYQQSAGKTIMDIPPAHQVASGAPADNQGFQLLVNTILPLAGTNPTANPR